MATAERVLSDTWRSGRHRDDYYDLGGFRADRDDVSPPTLRPWFDRGLTWCYAFNHEEAVRCFQRALEADPECAMAHWGIAYAIGPNYNKDWVAFEGDRSSLDAVSRPTRSRAARAMR